MRGLVAFFMMMAPLPALALSCIAPSVERSFAHFDAAEETYLVVHGRLTLNTRLLPDGMSGDQSPPKMTLIPAMLVGKSMGKSGFSLPFDQALTLEVSCLGPWCGSARNGEDVLAFVRKSEDGYAIDISPCGGSLFGSPKPAQLKQARLCFVYGTCKAD